MRNTCLVVLIVCAGLAASGAPRCEVRAGGDAQACIDRATGGDPATVWFAPGEHKVRTLMLRSNVTLELAAGATLSALIDGDGVTDVAIVGQDRGTSLLRGFVSLRNCHGVRMRGFTQEGGNGQGIRTARM